MLALAFQKSFWTLMLTSGVRSAAILVVYFLSNDGHQKDVFFLTLMLLVQGLIGLAEGIRELRHAKLRLRDIWSEWNRWYLIIGVANLLTAILPILGYWIGVSFSFVQIVSIPVISMGQTAYAFVMGNQRDLGTKNFVCFLSLFAAALLLGYEENTFHAWWVYAAILLAIVYFTRDQVSRDRKTAHGQQYVRAVAINQTFASLPVLVGGLVGVPATLILHSQQRIVIPHWTAGYSVLFVVVLPPIIWMLIASVSLEQLIARPRAGFRENTTTGLGKIFIAAVAGALFGIKQVNELFWLGLVAAVFGLALQYKAYRDREEKAARELVKM